MSEVRRVRVAVVCAEPGRAFCTEIELPDGATVAGALDHSLIRSIRPDIEIRADRVGIFGRKVPLSHVLHDGDRVEIYRPLRLDPKEARRHRAERGRG